MTRIALAYAILVPPLLVGCNSPASTSEVEPGTPQPPLSSVDERIQEAFRQPDLPARREEVLAAVDAFVRDDSVRQLDDMAASARLTDAAFSSGQLVFSDPGFVRRQGTLVVAGLPDGLGLFLYDLSTLPGTPPVQLSSWTVGLNAVDVVWAGGESGVSYVTIGSDQVSNVHYVLVGKSATAWQVVWFSDEQPDWWFNSRNATLSIAPYLSRLIVIGEAVSSTSVFIEEGDVPRRTFKVEWLREQDNYKLSPPVGSQPDRQAWLWHVAQPSAYATLVEFIERVRVQDSRGAARLVVDPEVVTAALSFGLYLPDVRYQIIAHTPEAITFQGQQGTFVATFSPPASEGTPWLIASLQPLGAALPDVTPTP